jgi:hypothetical protein
VSDGPAEPLAPWSDSTFDAIASVEAVLADDTEALAALLRHGSPYAMTVTLAKLVAELVTMAERNEGVGRCCFRRWAVSAVNKP